MLDLGITLHNLIVLGQGARGARSSDPVEIQLVNQSANSTPLNGNGCQTNEVLTTLQRDIDQLTGEVSDMREKQAELQRERSEATVAAVQAREDSRMAHEEVRWAREAVFKARQDVIRASQVASEINWDDPEQAPT